MKKLSIDEKWEIIKSYYQKFYRIKFKSRPIDFTIASLYESMLKLNRELKDYYFHHPEKWDRLEKRRGIAPQDDPLKKKKSYE